MWMHLGLGLSYRVVLLVFCVCAPSSHQTPMGNELNECLILVFGDEIIYSHVLMSELNFDADAIGIFGGPFFHPCIYV